LPFPWLDKVHEEVTQSVTDTAVWFDDFFDVDNMDADPTASGQARIRFGWEPRSTDLNSFDSRFRVRLKLPKLKNKADLVFSDYDEEERNAPIQAATNEAITETNKFNLALRWTTKAGPGASWSHRVGVGRKLQPFVKSRYRQVFELNQHSNLRWDTSFYYFSREGLGSHLELQYEHQLDQTLLFRFDNHFYYRDEFNDWVWQHGWYNFQQWDENTAWVYGVYLEGNSRPNYRIEEYLVSARWRKNALREWLFFEVEPFIVWRRDEGFNASFGMALRVEGFFGR